ncbi:hypothetical protein V8E55_012141 [Tylopilus felleus]
MLQGLRTYSLHPDHEKWRQEEHSLLDHEMYEMWSNLSGLQGRRRMEMVSEHSSQSLPSDAGSYDSLGQPRFGGVGQGAPLDENGRYIYSQVGMPIFASPSSPSPRAAQENLLKSPSNSNDMPADAVFGHGAEVNRPCLKRGRSSDSVNDSLPQTPHRLNTARGLFALGTPRLVRTMPSESLPSPRAPKRRRLHASASISARLQTLRMETLEESMKELQKDVRSILVKQTEFLAEILDVLREGSSKN